MAKLSKEYDISSPTIYNWIKQFKSIELDGDETADLNEVMKLKREMSKLKEENEVLKKCITIFSKKQ